SALNFLAVGAHGSQANQVFIVTYTDGTTQTFTRSISDWFSSQNFSGESQALAMAYHVQANGTPGVGTKYIYGDSLPVNSAKTLQSITLPTNANVAIVAMTEVTQLSSSTQAEVSLTGSYNRTGFTNDGTTFTTGLDGGTFAYSANQLAALNSTWNNIQF